MMSAKKTIDYAHFIQPLLTSIGVVATSLLTFKLLEPSNSTGQATPTPTAASTKTPAAVNSAADATNTNPTPTAASTKTPAAVNSAADATNTTPAPTAASIHIIVQAMLDNIKANGFNADKSINGGLGCLLINWKYGSSPLQTNINTSGITDSASHTPVRHDPLTDIRYLHALWLYKSQNPADHRYDDQIAKMTPIIKLEYAGSRNERAWLYDEEFMDLYKLSNDIAYKDIALSLVQAYSHAFNPTVGTLFKVSSAHPHGSYRSDFALQSACALIMAGTQFNNPQWVQQGQHIINFVYGHAYMPQYHMFPDQVDNVLLPDGSVNPHEPFLSGVANTGSAISGNQFRVGGIAQIILSFLHTYQVTHNQDYLNKATDLLDQLSLPKNPLGVWDTKNLGYFFGVVFSGTGPTNPGTASLKTGGKEAGRQMIMLQVYHLANALTNNKYQQMEQLMLTVALQKAYYAAGHGVLYEVNNDWTPYTHQGVTQNWVTTEAMGALLESLLAVTAP